MWAQYIYWLTCVCPPMLPDVVFFPLFYFGCLLTSFCVSDCLKYRENYVLDARIKKVK
jgi:hypothetical protein